MAEGTEMNVEAERAAFEAWTRKDIGMPDSVPFNWDTNWVKAAFEGWLERARRAAQPADVGATNPPEMPRPIIATRHGTPAYTVGQMLDYARDAIAADRRARGGEGGQEPVGTRMDAISRGGGEQSPQLAQGVKTWQERCDWWSERSSTKLMVEAMKAEIAELRAILAAPPLSSEQQAEKGAG